MNIKDFKDSLDYLFKAQLTAFVWGHAGLGKSTVMKQYAEEKGYKFFPFYLGTMSDVGDILGLATFTKDSSGNDVSTKFAPPVWLSEMIDYCTANPDSGAVILLDEFNRGRRDILNGMFSLALDKTFHTIKLPPNCHIIAAGNPPTDEYFTTDVNETALMGRFVHIKLEPSVQEWLDYAKTNSFEHTLISFIKEQPELLEDAKSEFVLPVKVDRRSYERLNRLFKIGTPSSILDQLAMGIIGSERLVAYKLHLTKTEKPLSAEEVFTGVGLDKIKSWSNPVNVQASYISNTLDSVSDALAKINKNKGVLTKEEGDNLTTVLETVPRDLMFAFIVKNSKESLNVYTDYIERPDWKPRLAAIVRDAKGKVKKS